MITLPSGYTKVPDDYVGQVWIEGQIRELERSIFDYCQPLTKEEIKRIRGEQFDNWKISESAFRHIARAIEAAHGIKERECEDFQSKETT